jgi:hypothetical protein
MTMNSTNALMELARINRMSQIANPVASFTRTGIVLAIQGKCKEDKKRQQRFDLGISYIWIYQPKEPKIVRYGAMVQVLEGLAAYNFTGCNSRIFHLNCPIERQMLSPLLQ